MAYASQNLYYCIMSSQEQFNRMRVAELYLVAIDEAAARLGMTGLDMFNHLEAREKAEGNYDAWMMMAACSGRDHAPSEETKAFILMHFRAAFYCQKNRLTKGL